MRYGVVGLGIGTLAAYAHAGDEVRFYEINPQVEELARSRFTYLDDCDGTPVVVLGDARITLQREAAGGEEGRFDAIFVDAFSGDSIPMHLLTLEAFELYFRHLRPDGALLVHISNLHLDLSDPVRTLARELGREAVQIDNYPDNNDENASRWVLVTKNRALIDAAEAEGALTPWETESPREMRWTDDYSNLLQAIAWD